MSAVPFGIVGFVYGSARKEYDRTRVVLMDHQLALKEDFLRTYDAYGDDIYRFCAVKVSNAELAQDLTQEVFMRYWQAVRDGKDLRNERAYLYTLARNLVIDWYRKKKESSLDQLTEQGIDFANDSHLAIEQGAQVNEILAVVNRLDDAARDVLVLRFVEGLTPREIAEITGESANAISVRINRAIKKVQTYIRPT